MSKKNQRKELGKGLRALLSSIDDEQDTQVENQEEVVKSLAKNIVSLPVDHIEENPFQPRTVFDEEALSELSSSIKTYGLIQPITVRRLSHQRYQLISGERRWRASKLAGLAEIPAYVRLADDQEMLEMALVENIQREQLNPIEVAISYQRLMDECNLSHELLSERVGKKRSTITNYVRLLKLPPQVQNELKDENLTMGHARALAGVQNIDQQLFLLKEILDKQMNVRQTEHFVRSLNKPNAKKQGKSKEIPLAYRKVEDSLRDILGSRVAIEINAQGKGKIQIPFQGTEEFNRIIELIKDS